MIRDFIKKIPLVGWFARFVYNILRINNLKHTQYMHTIQLNNIQTTIDGQTEKAKEITDSLKKLQNRLDSLEKNLSNTKEDLKKNLEKNLEKEISKEMVYSLASLHQRIDQFVFDTKIELQTDNSKVSRLDSLSKNSKTFLDDFYLEFENRFRGSREDILKRYEKYLDIIDVTNVKTSLDIGCGRGEWVELLTKKGIDAVGVDINSSMVKLAKSYGLNVIKEDIFTFLSDIDDNSYDLITAFHIIEHIPFESLLSLFVEIRRVLKDGGKVVVETPNPKNLLVASLTFYNDPTHLNPLPPDVVRFMLDYMGFKNTSVIELNPFGEEVKIKENSLSADMLNSLLFSEQDYLTIGNK